MARVSDLTFIDVSFAPTGLTSVGWGIWRRAMPGLRLSEAYGLTIQLRILYKPHRCISYSGIIQLRILGKHHRGISYSGIAQPCHVSLFSIQSPVGAIYSSQGNALGIKGHCLASPVGAE